MGIRDRGHYPEAWNNLGNVLREQGDFREADAALHTAIAQRRDYVEPYNSLALSLLAQERSEEAFAVLALAISAAPERPEPAFYLAQGLLHDRKAEGARPACQCSLCLFRSAPPDFVHLARVLLRPILTGLLAPLFPRDTLDWQYRASPPPWLSVFPGGTFPSAQVVRTVVELAVPLEDLCRLPGWVDYASAGRQRRAVTRKTVWWTAPGCTCEYRYGQRCQPATPMPQEVLALWRVARPHLGDLGLDEDVPPPTGATACSMRQSMTRWRRMRTTRRSSGFGGNR